MHFSSCFVHAYLACAPECRLALQVHLRIHLRRLRLVVSMLSAPHQRLPQLQPAHLLALEEAPHQALEEDHPQALAAVLSWV